MTDNRHIPQEDLALFAMNALPDGECALIRAHLADCPACRAELAQLHGDLALVAMSVEPTAVPQGARQRFLNRIASAANPASAPPTSTVIPIAAPRRIALWIPWAAVAAMILICAGLQWRVVSLSRELQLQSDQIARQTAANTRAHEVLELLTAPSAQRVVLTAPMPPKPWPTARAIYMPSRGALILQAMNLAPLPEGKAYELWVIPASGAPIPAGVFRPDTWGSASLVLPQLPKGVPAKAFGVTVENAAGSQSPTSPIVLSGAAPSSGE
ncbi:hypothetical protein DYQ86_11075 [Acidobacteria bacterium AB60]|nr:hypothetical protein DYQ86_11075 [Acidobacteria bacterium AB60]